MRPFAPETVLAALLALTVLAGAPDARACSCSGPHVRFLTPDRLDDVPLNTRVRLEVPARVRAPSKGRRVLRVHGSTAEVQVTERSFSSGYMDVVELLPTAPLAPSTQYEMAVIDPAEHPSTLVVGTFRTGTAADTAAPVVKNGGKAVAHRNVQFGGGSCSVQGPWIDVSALVAEDPSRPDAQILWGVWAGGPSGKIDPTKPPTVIVGTWRDIVTIGKRSLCDPHDFPLPAAGVFAFGLAPLDEAGNAGAMKIHRVDMGAATPEPRPW